MEQKYIVDGFFGFCIGDSLGVPVELKKREELDRNPVVGMLEYGTYLQPKGTWSDDSSLMFCTAESLFRGLNYIDMLERYGMWLYEGYWSARGQVFDVEDTTLHALEKFSNGYDISAIGGTDISDNSNGALMRMYPVAMYTYKMTKANRRKIVQNVSSLTHAHPISTIASSFYVELIINIIKKDDFQTALSATRKEIKNYYNNAEYSMYLKEFDRILNLDYRKVTREEIKSTGYVIDTLEACIWSLVNSDNYKDTVLSAVNLGCDTDTVAAITGAIAGMYYGISDIPIEWIEVIPRREDIFVLAKKFSIVDENRIVEKAI